MENNSESIRDKLIRHIRTTYKARYSASRRLVNIDKAQRITSIFIGVLIVAASTILLSDVLVPREKLGVFSSLLVVLSIISLVLSIVLGGTENKMKASEFHACGSEIQHLYDTILITQNAHDFVDQIEKYHVIIRKYRMNHDRIDWESILFEKRKENKKSIPELMFFKIKYFCISYLIYLLLMIVPIIAIVILLYNLSVM